LGIGSKRLVFDGYEAGIYMVVKLVKEIRYKVGIPSGPYQCWLVLGFCEGSTQKWSLESVLLQFKNVIQFWF
jgi:hypothetical protein